MTTRPSDTYVVLQAEQRHHRRADVRVVGERLVARVRVRRRRRRAVVLVQVGDARPDIADPRRSDLRLDAAVVPRERLVRGRGLARKEHAVVEVVVRARGRRRGRRARVQEEVALRERCERRRSGRVGGDHVEELLLDRVGHRHEEVCSLSPFSGSVTCMSDIACSSVARSRRAARRVARDVDVRREVGVDAEVRRRVRSVARVVRRDEPPEVTVDLGDVLVGARRGDAVAARVVGLRAGEVVLLLDRDHEQRVVLRDPVVLQAGEEAHRRPGRSPSTAGRSRPRPARRRGVARRRRRGSRARPRCTRT